MPTYCGNNSVHIVDTQTTFDPQTGQQTVETWEGTEEALISKAQNEIQPFGGKASIRQHEGPVYRMSVNWGDPTTTAAEQPIDRWERVTEYVQEDLRTNPNV